MSVRITTALCLIVSALGCGLASAGTVWSDEFNGDVIDSGTWTYDVSGGGFGNGQFEYATARHENSYTTNGNLVIEARRENYLGNSFTSARMLTQGRFAFKYGTLEARIKMPNTANGLWPAFWMLGNNFSGIAWPGCGEVDIVEMGSKAGIEQGLQQEKINCAMHFSGATGQYANNVAWTNATVDLSLDYHRYKVSWTPTSIAFYLDDVPYGSWDITAAHLSEFHQPMFPILNIAIGGYDPSYTGVYSPAAVTATFPARMYVDWIRLYDNPDTQLYYGNDIAETGNFGVYTETTPVNASLTYQDGTEPGFEYGTNAALYIWNNMTPATPPAPSEGSQCWSFDIAGGTWFGMGVLLPNFHSPWHTDPALLQPLFLLVSKIPLSPLAAYYVASAAMYVCAGIALVYAASVFCPGAEAYALLASACALPLGLLVFAFGKIFHFLPLLVLGLFGILDYSYTSSDGLFRGGQGASLTLSLGTALLLLFMALLAKYVAAVMPPKTSDPSLTHLLAAVDGASKDLSGDLNRSACARGSRSRRRACSESRPISR